MQRYPAFILLILLFSAGIAHGDTVPGTSTDFFRHAVDYVRNFFATPESGFNASAINIGVLDSGLPLVSIEHMSFFSPVFGREKNYTALLPPGYHNSSRRYPVYYLLHGAWGDERTWAARGDIVRIYQEILADEGVGREESASFGEMIIVMPDGGNSVWEDGCVFLIFWCGNYEDYLVEDFIPEVESRYRTDGGRGIGGLSFGARGAMRLAFLYTGNFDFVGAHSGYYDFLMQEMTEDGWDRVKSSGLVIYFDNSRNDVLTEYSASSIRLNRTLGERGIPHEYMELDFLTAQSHAWPYWKQQIKTSLQKACNVIC